MRPPPSCREPVRHPLTSPAARLPGHVEEAWLRVMVSTLEE